MANIGEVYVEVKEFFFLVVINSYVRSLLLNVEDHTTQETKRTGSVPEPLSAGC